jgi:AAA15 family ATPase/GTPase
MLIPDGNKFTYIIGNNGSGKSTSLAQSAIDKSETFPVVVIATGLSDRFTYGVRKKVNKGGGSYVYLGNRTVGNALHINTLSSNSVIYFGKLLHGNREKLFLDFLDKIGFEPVVYIRSSRKKRSGENYVEFDTVPFDRDFFDRYAELLEDRTKPFDAIFSRGDQRFPLGSLSSGEQTILSTALKLLSEREPRTIYYIDEPELSLHVEWQIQWPELFHDLLSHVDDAKLYVATHSPIIIARALQLGANCYNLRNGEIAEIQEENVNVERIIFNEFHTYTSDNRHIYSEFSKILGELVSRMNSNKNSKSTKSYAKKELHKISEKIEGVIATDEDKEFLSRALADFGRAVDEVVSINEK